MLPLGGAALGPLCHCSGLGAAVRTSSWDPQHSEERYTSPTNAMWAMEEEAWAPPSPSYSLTASSDTWMISPNCTLRKCLNIFFNFKSLSLTHWPISGISKASKMICNTLVRAPVKKILMYLSKNNFQEVRNLTVTSTNLKIYLAFYQRPWKDGKRRYQKRVLE